MKRLAALLLTTAALAATAAPASAYLYERGEPHPGSCGLGRMVLLAVHDPTLPGATEAARESPHEAGCTGSG
jgi:hypothetical protein